MDMCLRARAVYLHARSRPVAQGNYFGTAPYLVSPCAGLAKKAQATCMDGKDVPAAVAAAADADAIVFVVGLTSEGVPHSDEAEGHDRTSLLLPDNQDALIAAVATAAAGKPVAMVTMGGGPVDVSAARDNTCVGAIMWCGYPGQSGGDAIADAVFGVTNPGGKLTMTWYPESFAGAVSILDMGMRPNKTTGNPGRSHRFYTGKPVFAFGEGLSYTTFAASVPAVSLQRGAAAIVQAEAAQVSDLFLSDALGGCDELSHQGRLAGDNGVICVTCRQQDALVRCGVGGVLDEVGRLALGMPSAGLGAMDGCGISTFPCGHEYVLYMPLPCAAP